MNKDRPPSSAMPEGNSRLAEVVRGHLDVHLVAHADADEVFSHLTGDMGKHFMTVGERHPEHRARQDLGDRAGNFNWFFFSHATSN